MSEPKYEPSPLEPLFREWMEQTAIAKRLGIPAEVFASDACCNFASAKVHSDQFHRNMRGESDDRLD
jgi:hypothetical protein